jgi:protein SCO1
LRKRPPASVLWLGALAIVAVIIGVVVIVSRSSSSSASGSSSAVRFGTVIDQRVPGSLLHLPLRNQRGRRVNLASWPGKTVLLVPFLSLCSDICPLTTGNLLQAEESLRRDRAASGVQIVEISVDPKRDTPARLAAYAKLTGVRFQLVTERPRELAALARFFGFTYEKVPEGNPPSIDWWTGKPLTYDINHSDNYYVINPAGNERVVQDAAPDFHGHLNPKLYRFLSGLGHYHIKHPAEPDWTPADVLAALAYVLHRSLPVSLPG